MRFIFGKLQSIKALAIVTTLFGSLQASAETRWQESFIQVFWDSATGEAHLSTPWIMMRMDSVNNLKAEAFRATSSSGPWTTYNQITPTTWISAPKWAVYTNGGGETLSTTGNVYIKNTVSGSSPIYANTVQRIFQQPTSTSCDVGYWQKLYNNGTSQTQFVKMYWKFQETTFGRKAQLRRKMGAGSWSAWSTLTNGLETQAAWMEFIATDGGLSGSYPYQYEIQVLDDANDVICTDSHSVAWTNAADD